jgi:hypothetical protein
MTVRQVFYRLVSQGVINKTEGEYKSTVVRLLAAMRRAGELPFQWIADNTRWMRKPTSYSSLVQALERTAQLYRRSVWDQSPVYVEIWCEKDALAGVLYEETEVWDVPLMVTRGFSSLTYLYGAAEVVNAIGKPAYLYFFGDYDPSGLDITRSVEAGLREFAGGAEIYFERVALTPEQIAAWNLPTRPTKATDSRSRNFQGESVELDAIPPNLLRSLVRQHINLHVDEGVLEDLEFVEAEERRVLEYLARELESHG